MLPTPTAKHNDGQNPEVFLARRKRIKAQGINGNGFGLTLGMAVALLTMPTPVVADARGARNRTSGRSNPDSKHQDGVTLTDAMRLLPTAPQLEEEIPGSTGVSTSPPSDDGNTSSDDPPPGQLTIEDA